MGLARDCYFLDGVVNFLRGYERVAALGLIGFKLVVSRGQTAGSVFPLKEGRNTVGRRDPDFQPEVDLEDHDPEAKVSRRHAVVEVHGEALTLEDAGSMNGTFVNKGARLEPGQKHRLSIGDEIVIGKTFLRLES